MYVCLTYGHGSGFDRMELHRCSGVYWRKTTVRNGFVLYDLSTGTVYGLGEESVPAAKQIIGVDSVLSLNMSPVVPVFFDDDVNWTLLKVFRLDCDKYRSMFEGSSEVSGRRDEEAVDFDELLEKDPLWA